jgi:hypothetical protein
MQTLYYIGNKMYAKGIFVVLLFVAITNALSPYDLDCVIEKKGTISNNVDLFVSINIVRDNFSYPVVLDCKFMEHVIANSTNTNDPLSEEAKILIMTSAILVVFIAFIALVICMHYTGCTK